MNDENLETARDFLLWQAQAMRSLLTCFPVTEQYRLSEADVARLSDLFDQIDATIKRARMERRSYLRLVK